MYNIYKIMFEFWTPSNKIVIWKCIVLKLGSNRSDREPVGRPVRANIWIGHAVDSAGTGTGKNRWLGRVFGLTGSLFFFFFFAFSFTKTTSFWIFQLKKKKKLELEKSKKGIKTPKPHSLHTLLCFHVFFKLLLLLMTIIII